MNTQTCLPSLSFCKYTTDFQIIKYKYCYFISSRYLYLKITSLSVYIWWRCADRTIMELSPVIQ